MFSKDEAASMMQTLADKGHGDEEDQIMSQLLSQESFKELHENWLLDFL
jgi:hypothetical protein